VEEHGAARRLSMKRAVAANRPRRLLAEAEIVEQQPSVPPFTLIAIV